MGIRLMGRKRYRIAIEGREAIALACGCGRPTYANDQCRACYMRAWRQRPTARALRPEVEFEATSKAREVWRYLREVG